MQKEKAKAQSEKVDKTISEIPDWCIDMKQTNLSLVACGSGISSNLNMAMNRAILDAKRQLADTINSELSSNMDDYLKSTGAGGNEQVKQASELVTKNTIIQAKLIGYKQIKKQVANVSGKFQYFVLLEYPIGEANQALLEKIKGNEILSTQKGADKAMADLEKEIEKRNNN
tara:strand:+ start:60 stop:575 length:516 start_codon:yes stop_codon:yes gene_type:complete